MYRARNISYTAGSRVILQNMNIRITPGKFTAVLGANGAGKSTLLKIISGETKKYQGKVELNGQPLTSYSQKELALQRAVLSQNPTVQFPFTVREIVMLGCMQHHCSQEKKEELVTAKLQEVGMLDFQERIFMTLSGGEQQRVQLARVMAQIDHPHIVNKYLLLDEPTASLDMASQQLIFSKVKALCQTGIGVLAIVHDLNLAIRYADYFYFISQGSCVAEGNAAAVFTTVNIEKTFHHPVRLLTDTQTGLPIVIPEINNQSISIKPLNSTYYASVHR